MRFSATDSESPMNFLSNNDKFPGGWGGDSQSFRSTLSRTNYSLADERFEVLLDIKKKKKKITQTNKLRISRDRLSFDYEPEILGFLVRLGIFSVKIYPILKKINRESEFFFLREEGKEEGEEKK